MQFQPNEYTNKIFKMTLIVQETSKPISIQLLTEDENTKKIFEMTFI